ncbi:hypothetical protein RPPS3_40700 [Rhodopseudomonas palustris]|uniref:glycosyltransferase n=1 Tax=Rhodopseudomonas palustris TaxID=1076 RepID=UPI000D1BDDA2|nr:glycosyltransferase [Rhodopseudomonas palustris]AVT78132.1 hypothetical protein RPPS3_40700 [Rhodopseudomonas palustris]
MIKVAHIITGLSVGGAEGMLLEILRRIDRSTFDCRVLSLTGEGPLAEEFRKIGIITDTVTFGASPAALIATLDLIRWLRDFGPDVVQTWMPHANLIGAGAALAMGIKARCWSLHAGNLDRKYYSNSTYAIIRLSAALSKWLPNRIISCSRRGWEAHERIGYDPTGALIIPNGVDVERMSPHPIARELVRSEIGIDLHTPLVGMIARFDPQKNHMGFLIAAGLINEIDPSVHFVLAGDRADGSNSVLVDTIHRGGLTDRFHLLGRRNDIPSLLSALDVLASPSHGEAFPVALIEAMACEIPCVVTNAGDSAAIVGETGRVVECGNMRGLAQGILELLQLPKMKRRELGQLARLRVLQHFDINQTVLMYEGVYRTLMKNASLLPPGSEKRQSRGLSE